MKALYISRNFYPEGFGGGEISALHIAKAVTERNNEVVICCLSKKIESPKIEKIENIKIYRFPWRELKLSKKLSNLEYVYWQIYRATKEVIKREKPDLIHFLNFQAIFPLALFFKKCPKFATINGPIFCEFGGSHPNGKPCYNCKPGERFSLSFKKWGPTGLIYWLYNRYAQFTLKLSLKKCTKLFPVSYAIQKMLISARIKEEKTKVIHNPINTNNKTKTNLKERLRIPTKTKIILYAGRLSKDKGIHHTIRAIKDIDNIKLIIAGEKRNYYKKLKKLVEDLNLKEKVTFVGFIENNKINEYFSIADFIVHPCFFYEPLSRMLLEAASYGLPLIASNVGGNLEIIKDKKNGFIINNQTELKEKIVELIENKSLREKMGQNSKRIIEEKFEGKKIGNLLVEEYKRYLKERL